MASMTKWTVIVPSNRPEEMQKFLHAWASIFFKHNIKLVIMWDLPEIPANINDHFGEETTFLCWKDVEDSGLSYIPRKTDMIRSFAFWWAYNNTDAKYFLTLDDDVRPLDWSKWIDSADGKHPSVGDIFEEYEKVFIEGEHLSEYFSVARMTTTPMRTEMRGYPYKDRVVRPVAVQYGGWWGTLDYDAATQLSEPREPQQFALQTMPVPKGAACTCCIMNCAWQRKYTPIMWQLPMLDGRYNRVGDIWSGLFIKKTLDSVGAVMVINGKASVLHERASNPYNSLVKEAPSVWINDNLWEAISEPPPSSCGEHFEVVYWWFTESAIEYFEKHDKEYADHFRKARDEWEGMWR
jgi:hypothetical protein